MEHKGDQRRIIKLSVEIKEDRLIFSYKIGTSEMNGDMALDSQRFLLFSKLLCDLQNAESKRYNSLMQEITGKAWIEKYPKKAVRFIQEQKARGRI